ncbi:hypothetical protein OIY81_2525 [Cryptosporidium canis]|uniref:Ubiquinone biosynthesis protein COQ4 homolog, mitochondrial n=1 Tax=Cryptosporidium canis TaxID=195482 RepID=A0ABQ8P5J3_9CRYT|nr:hypothetical protein OJ252_2694 [Cryptosporidium canis]KAJ1608989.1 hypothetical protein OIY81_2525 [Cryptosporidium canis]
MNRFTGLLARRGISSLKRGDFRDLFRRNYVPITKFEKILLSISSSMEGLKDPTDSNPVACITELTSTRALRRLHVLMRSTPDGRNIIKNKPLIDSSRYSIKDLLAYPADSLGRRYGEFLTTYGFEIDRPPVRYVNNEDLAYIMTRFRQIHDIIHTVLELNVTVESEVALKLFEFLHAGIPFGALATFMGLFITPVLKIKPKVLLEGHQVGSTPPSKPVQIHKDCDSYFNSLDITQKDILYPRRTVIKELIPWIYTTEKKMKHNIYTLMVEDWFPRPIREFQSFLNVSPPPEKLQKYTRIEPMAF